MKSPQSPHSSSLWVFALSLRVLSELSPPAPISHLGTKLLVYGFSVFDLRVISVATLFGHTADSPMLLHFPPLSGPDREEPVLTQPL